MSHCEEGAISVFIIALQPVAFKKLSHHQQRVAFQSEAMEYEPAMDNTALYQQLVAFQK